MFVSRVTTLLIKYQATRIMMMEQGEQQERQVCNVHYHMLPDFSLGLGVMRFGVMTLE